jgi:PQQ-dependent catabolism-associated CXXCW motif protein
MRRAAALLVVQLLAGAADHAWATVPEPEGYRMEEYRAPVPATLEGATVVDTEKAAEHWRNGSAIFVDVLPKPPMPDLPEGTIWREPPRFNIPGSVWLPDVGLGVLSGNMEEWYRANLAKLTGGNRTKAVVLYCKADCWMSWNAAKRAVEWGYTDIGWYPEGTDGWAAARLPLEESTAVPRPGAVTPAPVN